MSEHFFLNEQAIQHLASPQSYRRGDQYEHDGAVLMLLQRGHVLQADVQGSEDEPYFIQIRFGDTGVSYTSCTCPYDHEGICKHIVATLLAAIRHPELIGYLPPIETKLEELSREQLQTLLIDLVETFPETSALVDRFIAIPNESEGASLLPLADQRALRHEIRTILHDTETELYAYNEWDDAPDESAPIMHLVAPVTEYLRMNRAAEARIILEAITDECINYWAARPIGILHDSELAILAELAAFWVTTILYEPAPSRILALFEDWIVSLDEYLECEQPPFETVLLALETDWESPAMQALWQDETPSQIKLTPREVLLVPYRLEVLDLQGKFVAYKALALAADRHIDYALRLLIDGEIAAALEHARSHLQAVDQAYEFALELWEQHHYAEALEFAEYGLTLPIALDRWGTPFITLAQVSRTIRDWHIARGNEQKAREAAVDVIMRQLTLADYHCVVRIFGPHWHAQRPKILERLARRHNPLSIHTLLDILLDEHEGAKALNLAKQYPINGDLLQRVVQAAVVIEPEWAIKIAQHEGEQAIGCGSSYYPVAAHWLRLMRDAMISSNHEAEWSDYYSALCEQHQRKYRLIEALKPLIEH